MKKALLIFGFIILLLIGWFAYIATKAENYENAIAYYEGSFYKIELKGVRYLMAHDPVTALMGETYEKTYIINTPRITGVVSGNEIPVKKGYYKYLGNIIFKENKMIIDLYYDNYDDGIKDPISWNGEYILTSADEAK
jgi:hypothetical protein